MDPEYSISGFVVDGYEGVSAEFTQRETIATRGHNVLTRAKRYGRWHALKSLTPDAQHKTVYQEMLRKEMEILMQLQHPCVEQVMGMEDVPGLGRCIVLEWIDGLSLAEWLAQQPPLDQRHRMLEQLLDALAYVHSRDIVHRDLKPSNIMITGNGHNVKLIDFGLADTDAHAILKQPAGTLRYMAPEQAASSQPDVRNDIYSLGIVMQQMELGRKYNPVIARCLMPIDSRYQSVEELVEDIQASKKRRNRIQMAAFAIGVSLIVAIILLGMGYFGRKKLENPSGQYQFECQDFVCTNWTNGSTNTVSVQYAGEGKQHIVVDYSVAENSNIWVVCELGFGCFRDVANMESLTIEAQNFGIQKHAFKGCKNLKTITMPRIDTPPSIGNGGWKTVIDSIFEPYHYEQVTLYVPNVEKMRADTCWGRFKHIEKYKNNE